MKNLHGTPRHYTQGAIEPIDYMRDNMTPLEFRAYCKGNVIKYVSRYQHKGTALVDLEKAEDYLRWMRESLNEELNGD